MSDQAKRTLGAVLLVVALGLAVAAAVMWSSADRDAEKNPFNSAFGLADPPPADHTPSIILLAGAGVAVLSGVVLLAASKAEVSTGTKAKSDAGGGWG